MDKLPNRYPTNKSTGTAAKANSEKNIAKQPRAFGPALEAGAWRTTTAGTGGSGSLFGGMSDCIGNNSQITYKPASHLCARRGSKNKCYDDIVL
jgi:hypothetical protein